MTEYFVCKYHHIFDSICEYILLSIGVSIRVLNLAASQFITHVLYGSDLKSVNGYVNLGSADTKCDPNFVMVIKIQLSKCSA